MALDLDKGQLGVGDRDAFGIATPIELGPDAGPGCAMRQADEAHNGREVHERCAGPPVHGDLPPVTGDRIQSRHQVAKGVAISQNRFFRGHARLDDDTPLGRRIVPDTRETFVCRGKE